MFNGQIVKVVIPALNEAASIGKVITAIPKWVDEIIVADNGSTDQTSQVASKHGAHVITEAQRGYGQACLAVRMGLAFREVPVSYRQRIGQSKISGTIKGSVMAGSKILWTILRKAVCRVTLEPLKQKSNRKITKGILYEICSKSVICIMWCNTFYSCTYRWIAANSFMLWSKTGGTYKKTITKFKGDIYAAYRWWSGIQSAYS